MKFLVIFMMAFGLLFGAININTADKKELMSLEGIGAKKAEAIIQHREKNKFNTIEDIKSVKGISDKLFDKIKNDISIDGATTPIEKKNKKDNKKTKDSKKEKKSKE